MYEVYSLPCAKYENPSNDERPPRPQHLKSEPPGGQYDTAKVKGYQSLIYEAFSLSVSKSPTKVDMYESSSEWRVSYLALPKSPYKVTPASTWYENPSKLDKIYEDISALEIVLASPRSFYKISSKADALNTSSKTDVLKTSGKTDVIETPSKTDVIKTPSKADVIKLPSKRYEIKTHSKSDVIKLSSSLCQKYPRLQYLRYKKSQPREGITRHDATSALPAFSRATQPAL